MNVIIGLGLVASVARGLAACRHPRLLPLFLVAAQLAWVGNAAAQPFRIADYLGHAWRNERVTFPLSASAPPTGPAEVVDDAGRNVPAEVVDENGRRHLELLIDLSPFQTRTFAFAPQAVVRENPIRIGTRDGLLLIEGPVSGLALRTVVQAGTTPIAALRSVDRTWMPVASTIEGAAVTAYAVHVERRGPVAAAVRAETRFADGVTWTLRVTVQAGDPAVLIEERWSRTPHAAASLTVAPADGLDSFTYRVGAGARLGFATTERASDDRPVTFEIAPWLHWWLKERRGVVVVASGQSRQAITLAALHADRWVAPAATTTPPPSAPIVASLADGKLSIHAPVEGVARDWLIAVTAKAAAIDDAGIGQRKAQPAQRLVIRNSDFPLDRIKAIGDRANALAGGPRPRLMLAADDLRRLSDMPAGDPQRKARVLGAPLNDFTLPDHVDMVLRTHDPAIQARLTAAAPAAMQKAVDVFLSEDEQMTLGFAPHNRRDIFYAVHLADFAFADPALARDVAARMRAQAAFLADTVSRPDYWSPERGLAANPNITSAVAANQGLLACLLDGHPDAKTWLDRSLAELYGNELLTWSDAKGGWLEAPHYATVSLDYMLGVFLCARNAGRPQPLADPRTKAVLRWLAQITTPPDPRLGNARRLPAIGNTYMLEPTGLFGLAAFIWRTADPVFSAEMQWMHQASGSPELDGAGGWWPAMAPYQRAFKATKLAARAPAYGSMLFPETGAILRSYLGSRETQMYLIAGRNHAHYDFDSGSVTLWGKGELLADDFGYNGQGPASDHSMVESKATGGRLDVKAFSSQAPLDYVKGVNGPWTRQILFVKDPDPLGPNYFVLRDTLASGQGVWRLWLTADHVVVSGNRATVVGKGDVDMDIVFLSGAPPDLSVEEASRTSVASGLANKPFTTTQTALRASMKAGAELVVLLYPRLKTQSSPNVVSRDGGRSARIETPDGADMVFLADQAFSTAIAGTTFDGVAGARLVRGSHMTLALGAGGALASGSVAVRSQGPAFRTGTTGDDGSPGADR